MVVALKELSIRGDFRTTVEFMTKLLETDSFQHNCCDTAWLDQLIAEKVQVGTVSLICSMAQKKLELLIILPCIRYLRYLLEFQAEKPDIMLSVICGSLHVADRMILGSFQNFQSTLERYVWHIVSN